MIYEQSVKIVDVGKIGEILSGCPQPEIYSPGAKKTHYYVYRHVG